MKIMIKPPINSTRLPYFIGYFLPNEAPATDTRKIMIPSNNISLERGISIKPSAIAAIKISIPVATDKIRSSILFPESTILSRDFNLNVLITIFIPTIVKMEYASDELYCSSHAENNNPENQPKIANKIWITAKINAIFKIIFKPIGFRTLLRTVTEKVFAESPRVIKYKYSRLKINKVVISKYYTR